MELRVLHTHEEFEAIEELQAEIWHFEPLSVTPRHVFIAGARSGGLVLGAYDHNNRMVGFSLGFRGQRYGEPCLYSHLTGVLPSLQGQGLGCALKMAQWEFARETGLSSIVWTFDPLMMPNAKLNLQKLGAVVYRFIPNAYGASAFKMYGEGFPTHRFEIFWRVAQELPNGIQLNRPQPFGAGKGSLSPMIEVRDGVPQVNEAGLEAVLAGQQGLLEIPENHLAMRESEPELARLWQNVFFHCAKHCLETESHFVEAFTGIPSGGAYLVSPR